MAINKKRILHLNNHLYYNRGTYATRKAANKSAKSWQDYGSFTHINNEKAHLLYPKETRTVYILYATKKLKRGKR